MFKLDRKLIISTIAVSTATLLMTGCFGGAEPSKSTVAKPSIDGGVYYPVKNGKTSSYHVNENTLKGGYSFGRTPTANELKAWNKDIMPDGTGLPEGSGSVEDGEEIYESKCVMCHGDFGSGGGGYPALSKGNAYDMQKTLKNQRNKPDADGPVRVFGSYWPHASTLFWYIKDGMPHPRSKTLSDDEVYALCAYILNINEMEIDGEEVDDEYILDRSKFLKIKMPNRNGFEPSIDGKDGLKNIRTYFANPSNFGAIKVKPSERCMTNCQKPTAKVVHIKGVGISDFHPPLTDVKDLPKEEGSTGFNAKKAFTENCAMCHGSAGMGAPVIENKKDWDKVIAKGMDKVYYNGIHGINGMPPKGGSELSDADFKSVVDYIVNLSK